MRVRLDAEAAARQPVTKRVGMDRTVNSTPNGAGRLDRDRQTLVAERCGRPSAAAHLRKDAFRYIPSRRQDMTDTVSLQCLETRLAIQLAVSLNEEPINGPGFAAQDPEQVGKAG